MSSMATPEAIPQAFLPAAGKRLGRNPMLPEHPITTAVDAQYEAQNAILRATIAKQYADILQQLGSTSETGEFMPGSISSEAARQESDLRRSSDLAEENVTGDAQRSGTLFSGRRGTDTARAQYPYQQGIQQLGTTVPLQLAQLHERASGLVDQYSLQNNQLLADAALRAASAITASGGGGYSEGPATAPSGGGLGGTSIVGPGPLPPNNDTVTPPGALPYGPSQAIAPVGSAPAWPAPGELDLSALQGAVDPVGAPIEYNPTPQVDMANIFASLIGPSQAVAAPGPVLPLGNFDLSSLRGEVAPAPKPAAKKKKQPTGRLGQALY